MKDQTQDLKEEVLSPNNFSMGDYDFSSPKEISTVSYVAKILLAIIFLSYFLYRTVQSAKKAIKAKKDNNKKIFYINIVSFIFCLFISIRTIINFIN